MATVNLAISVASQHPGDTVIKSGLPYVVTFAATDIETSRKMLSMLCAISTFGQPGFALSGSNTTAVIGAWIPPVPGTYNVTRVAVDADGQQHQPPTTVIQVS